jgi:hypothetical protein
MAANPTVPDELNGDAPCPSESDVVVQWPLSYRLNLPEGQAGEPSQPQWWHHYYYRNSQNQKPKVLYSSTKGASEENARLFLSETVLGFDMEWPWQSDSTRLQEKVGLIQIASESRIGLFRKSIYVYSFPFLCSCKFNYSANFRSHYATKLLDYRISRAEDNPNFCPSR